MPRSSGQRASPDAGRAKLRKALERHAPWIVLAVLALAWEGASRGGLVDPLILPPPTVILRTGSLGLFGKADVSYHIGRHAAQSFGVLAVGFTAGVMTGIAGGVVLGVSSTLYRTATPILAFVLPIPAIAWAPVAMIWIGLGVPAVLTIVIYACFAEVLFNTTMGIRAVPRRYLWQAQTFGASRWFLLAHVMLPSALPFILGGIKLGLAASWRSLVGAEMFAGVGAGLGLMLYDAQNFYATDVMFFALVLVATASVSIEQLLLRTLERRTVERWGMMGAPQT
jgi:NitT/TauT family transport system permease protein